MLELVKARDIENQDPLGIQYHVRDASKPIKELGQFDVVFAAWLLVYSKDKKMMKQFLVNVDNLLKEGGIFVTITADPDNDQSIGAEMIPYGITRCWMT